ncbi:unnamed protein product [Pocillopora meandrina]|uniref:Uncharacterized protein n=1 Tax=Pocillopora meandrina TaxID=46732 RepID=A0AAU9Y0B0_9CNID|nr:unnamed protein product [Pocillopora meandrina]
MPYSQLKLNRRAVTIQLSHARFTIMVVAAVLQTENIRRQLGIDGVKVMLQLTTMHGQSQVESIILDDLIVTSLDDENPIELPRSYTRDEIPAEHHQIPTPSLINQWSHLSEVAKKIPELEPRLEIGLLIGSNCPPALEPLEVVPCRRWPICPPSPPWLDSLWTSPYPN